MFGSRPATSAEYTIQPTRPHSGSCRPPLGRPGDHHAARPGAHRGARPAGADAEGRGRGRRAEAHADRPQGQDLHAHLDVHKVVTDGAFMSAYLPEGKVTLLRIDKPLAGTWTLTPQPGSPAIDEVRTAERCRR